MNVKELLSRSSRHIWSLSDSNEIRTNIDLVRKQTFNHLANLVMLELFCKYLSAQFIGPYVIKMSRPSFRVNPQSIVCLNVKELLVWTRRHIWSLSDSNEIQTENHLVSNT